MQIESQREVSRRNSGTGAGCKIEVGKELQIEKQRVSDSLVL